MNNIEKVKEVIKNNMEDDENDILQLRWNSDIGNFAQFSDK